MDEPKEGILGGILDAIGCLCGILLFIGLFVGMTMLRFEGAKNALQNEVREATTPQGYLIGRVKSVETWQAEPYVEKDGNMTLTLQITDRCRVLFEDGRSKEFLGMPREPIPTDKDVAITYGKYNVFLEAVPAEEFRKKQAESEPKAGETEP